MRACCWFTELKSRPTRPAAPPKPKVIIQKPATDVVALEHLIVRLQREASDYKLQVHEQSDIITGLRRDLSGATARLSDLTGNISITF